MLYNQDKIINTKLNRFLRKIEAPCTARELSSSNSHAIHFEMVDDIGLTVVYAPEFLKHPNFFADFEQANDVHMWWEGQVLKLKSNHSFAPRTLSPKFIEFLKEKQIPWGNNE